MLKLIILLLTLSLTLSQSSYNDITNMINELKEKTIMLEKIIAKKNDLSFNDKNATLYYDDSSLKRLLTSSDPIKVSGFCDNRMMIYVNGDLMVNTELWDYVEYRYTIYKF